MALRDFVSTTLRDDVFNNVADTVTYNPQGSGVPASILGIFSRNYLEVLIGEMPVESAKPMCVLRQTDVPALATGDKLSFQGTDYRIVELRPAPSGVVLVILEDW